METNFSSDRSRARQLSTNDVDSLLYQAVDEVEMSDVELEFWRLFETFSPELSEDVDCSSVSLPVGRTRSSPALVFHTSPSPTKPPASPQSSSDSSFVFSLSPVRPQPSLSSSSAVETPRAPWESPGVLDLSPSSQLSPSPPRKISSQALNQLLTGDLVYSRKRPVSPGLPLQSSQGSLQPPPKKPKLSGRDQDLNADIAEEAGEVERSSLIRELAEKFLLAVPSGHHRVSLKPAGDCSPVTQDASGEDSGSDCPNQRRFLPQWEGGMNRTETVVNV